MSNLENFLSFSKPSPKALATSQEIRDRGSTFVASIYRANDANEVRDAINQLKNVVHASHPASHEMYAWRCMVLKPGRDGLAGPDDFELRSGCEDDGEKYGASKILKGMEAEKTIDAVVIVSRWYGGIMIGPARFSHIETCTREVCRLFKAYEDVESYIGLLMELDDDLSNLRKELAGIIATASNTPLEPEDKSSHSNTTAAPSARKFDYSTLLDPPDVQKARRLLAARQNAVESVKRLIATQRNVPAK